MNFPIDKTLGTTGLVVRFSSLRVGTVIANGDLPYSVGEHKDYWIACNDIVWKPVKNIRISLHNKIKDFL